MYRALTVCTMTKKMMLQLRLQGFSTPSLVCKALRWPHAQPLALHGHMHVQAVALIVFLTDWLTEEEECEQRARVSMLIGSHGRFSLRPSTRKTRTTAITSLHSLRLRICSQPTKLHLRRWLRPALFHSRCPTAIMSKSSECSHSTLTVSCSLIHIHAPQHAGLLGHSVSCCCESAVCRGHSLLGVLHALPFHMLLFFVLTQVHPAQC